MKPRPNATKPAQVDVRAAWQEQLHKQANPELANTLCQRETELFPRFDFYYQRLQTLPRRWRRGVQRSLRLSLAGVGLALALGQQAALAATIIVDGNTCNLIDAINAANTDTATGGCPAGSGADTLVLPIDSTIALTERDNTTYAPGNGLPVISSPITIEGNGSTIERSIRAPEFRILAVSVGGDLTLNNATITGGGVFFEYLGGAGILSHGSSSISNSTIRDNRTDHNGGSGGGLRNHGDMTIVGSTVSENWAAYGTGGGVFNQGSLTITNSTISGNRVASLGSAAGGGVTNGGDMTITDSAIYGNFSNGRYGSFGGGVSNGGSLTITGSTVFGNSGGGVSNGGALTITNSTIFSNMGGGVSNDSEIKIADSTIFGNEGGGLSNGNEAEITKSTISGNRSFVIGGSGVDNRGDMTITNSTISDNQNKEGYSYYSRVYGGGGVSNSGALTIANSTITGNSSAPAWEESGIGAGGGVYNRGSLILNRTLISGNAAPHGEEIYGNNIIAEDYNLLGDSSNTNAEAFIGFIPGATDITATSDGTQPTALGNILKTWLADNGGPTETHALVAGSPAIDASPADADCPPADQRGAPRPFDGTGDGMALCDIGAVEERPPSEPAFPPMISVSDLDGSNGFVIVGPDEVATYAGYSVSAAGDLNGDRIGDVIIGAYREAGYRSRSYVVFGRSEGFAASINLSDLDGSNGFRISGEIADRWQAVSYAGDINGDQIDDVILGSAEVGPAGQSYVVFGRRSGFPATLSLSTLNGSNGFVIHGIDEGDSSGSSVSDAGDVNGDGIGDVIIGAPWAQGLSAEGDAGESYVVFGHKGDFAAVLNLSDLDGSNGFVIQGANENDLFGRVVSAAGDVNGDQIDDVIIADTWASPNGTTRAGASYVVFGRYDGFPASLSLSDLDGTNGFAVHGVEENGRFGRSVSGAGDVNRDGVADVIIGSIEPPSAVVFGTQNSFPASLTPSLLDGTNGFVINNPASSVSAAGDINDDGVNDVILQGSYVLFGDPGRFPLSIDVSHLDGRNGFRIQGEDTEDVADAGDVNGDGVDDVIIGTRRKNESYVVFGRRSSDTDWDGMLDQNDNCILIANGPLVPDAGGNSQRDTDGDGYGNVCDPDFDGNATVNFADLAYMKSKFFTADPDADLDGDGNVNFADLAILKSMFFGPPGPSGVAP